MKHFLFAALLLSGLFIFTSYCFNQQQSFVIDKSGLLDSLQKQKLNELYRNHERKTTNQIVLLTTDSFAPYATIENYALHAFQNLKIGQKNKNNGVLIVFSKPMRRVRITTGYGTEKVLTDSIAKKFIDSLMVPQFKQQKYFEGIWEGSNAITNFLERPENVIK